MALHAGFAAALSVTTETAQAVIHAAYVNNILPAVLSGTQPIGSTQLAFDLVIAEPQLELADGAGRAATIFVEAMGTLTFTGPGKPTISCGVHATADVTMTVIMVPNSDTTAMQFGLDGKSPTVSVLSASRTSGDDPNPAYGIDPSNTATVWGALLTAITNNVGVFLLTPPQLSQLVQVNYIFTTLGVNNSKDSLNVGVDIQGLTTGVEDDLVDLNRVSTAKGFKKTLMQSVHTSDDEYGEPLYDTVWSGTKLRTAGPHNTGVAISLNVVVLNDIFLKFGRWAVLSEFEQSKYDHVMTALGKLQGPSATTTYEPSDEALTSIDKINLGLHTDYVHVTGTASNYSAIAIHTDFELKLRIVRVFYDGDTQFLMGYADGTGITAELYDVNVEQPGWLTFAEVVGAVVGVVLAPFTDGISLMVIALLEALVMGVVGNLTSNAGVKLSDGVMKALSGFSGQISFTLPGTSGPTLVFTPDDVVMRLDAATAWFNFSELTNTACIHLQGFPSADNAPVVTEVWEATDLQPFVVILDDGGQLFNAFDPRVRIQWQIFGNTKSTLIATTDVEIHSAAGTKQVSVDHASAALEPYDVFIVTCRVYRPWDSKTQELFTQELRVTIDDRLYRTHPYVHWDHTVHYEGFTAFHEPLGWVTKSRKSRIHYTDPKKRCRFADRYSKHLTRDDLIYIDDLPFPITEAKNHRDVICSYCFFGGPDKSILKV